MSLEPKTLFFHNLKNYLSLNKHSKKKNWEKNILYTLYFI